MTPLRRPFPETDLSHLSRRSIPRSHSHNFPHYSHPSVQTMDLLSCRTCPPQFGHPLGAGGAFPWGPAPPLHLLHRLGTVVDRGEGAEFGFQHQRAGGKAAVPTGDDGVCLTTLRDRNGTVKGGVRRQAPSRPGLAAERRTEPLRPDPRHPTSNTIHLTHSELTFHRCTGKCTRAQVVS